MENKEEILLSIKKFLNQPVIYEPQIIAFENKLLKIIKNKKLNTVFIKEINLIKSKVVNGLYVPTKKNHIIKVKINLLKKSLHKISKVKVKKDKTVKLQVEKPLKKVKPLIKIIYKDEINQSKNASQKINEIKIINDNIVGLTVEELANKLKISSSYLISIFEQSNIFKESHEKIDKMDSQIIKNFINSRISALNKIEKKNKLIGSSIGKKYNYSPSRPAGVYSQIAKFGLGKIIYIRSK
jgi:hypothetical protein